MLPAEKVVPPAGDQPAAIPWPGELVLGVRKDQHYSTFTTRLGPGQSLLLYTDGADEAMGQSLSAQENGQSAGEGGGEIYGEARLTASVDTACRASQSPQDIIAHVRQDLLRHMGDGSPADDISLMVLPYRGAEQHSTFTFAEQSECCALKISNT